MAEQITGHSTRVQPATGAHPATETHPAAETHPATEPKHRIRALHTESTVTVYQAYTPSIGLPAARDARFPAVWKRDRMTWIKPSFLWMMYRCGWAAKEGQETVLAVAISRSGFDWALRNACLSSYERSVHDDQASWKRELKQSPARVQWDPERDLWLRPQPYRSLQLGLSGDAVRRYADEWTVSITDVTPLVHRIHALVLAGDATGAAALLPRERAYPVHGGLLSAVLPRGTDEPGGTGSGGGTGPPAAPVRKPGPAPTVGAR